MLWSAAVTKGYACPLWLTFKQAYASGEGRLADDGRV
jgi:antirestriction protein ArdC